VSEPRVYHLDRFYYGNLVFKGKRLSVTPGVVARTAHITPEQVAESVRVARLRPPAQDETTPDMPGALGLFRGQTLDFVLVKAQQNEDGFAQVLYILLPNQALQASGGNVLAFRSLAMMDMPSFRKVRTDLQPYTLNPTPPPTPDEQQGYLNSFLLYCHDSFKNVEGLLAALVQGWPIAIVNAPPSTEKRLHFLQGLLSFLPGPARAGITFATHASDPGATMTQVKFTTKPAMPAQHLVYDWLSGELLTSPPKDSYSHYMVSQLRLDPVLVVEQTEELSRTAIWRAMQKENLGSALTWVSRRAAIDQTVREGQPADRNLVAQILREDPTLTDDLRKIYIRHLMAFALALDEPDSVDVVPAICATRPAVAAVVQDLLADAIENGKAATAYAILKRWLIRVPETLREQWHQALAEAARHHVIDLLKQQRIGPATQFLDTLATAPAALGLADHLHEIVRDCVPYTYTHRPLAEKLVVIAAQTLPASDLYRLFQDSDFVAQLHPDTQAAIAHLHKPPGHPSPAHVLDKGARAVGERYRILVLVRFVEAAMYGRRVELVDAPALMALLVIAQSPQAEHFRSLILHTVRTLSEVSMIQVLEPPGPRVLIQLLLQIEAFDEAISLLEFYQDHVFGPQKVDELIDIASELFNLLKLTPDKLTQALVQLEGSRIWPKVRIMLYAGALSSRDWATDQDYAARRVTTMIFNDNSLIGTIGFDTALKLLDFHARQHNALDALRVGAAVVDHTLEFGQKGAELITRMWPAITWDTEVAEAAQELLRRFLRGTPHHEVPALIAYLETELGSVTGPMLRATWLLRLIMGDQDFLTFAEEIQTAAKLLCDIAAVYHTDKELPPKHRLRHELDTLTGGLSDHDRAIVAQNMLEIARLIHELGQLHARQHGRKSPDAALIRTEQLPVDGVDFLLFAGGHLSSHEFEPLSLHQEGMSHLFGSRSAAILLRETTTVRRLLEGLHAAFKEPAAQKLSLDALCAELDSLWNSLSLFHQRRLQKELTQDYQHLAQVIQIMAAGGHERILSDSNLGRELETGRRQPRTSLEALRWIHGYFARKHIRTRP